jgi:ComF family protein
VSFVRGTAAAADRLIGLLFPNRCVFCGSVLDTGRCVCGGCLLELELIDGPVCGRCGAPVKPAAPSVIGGRIPAGSGGSSPAVSCPQCEDLSFGFRINESMGIYTGKLRELIQHYKFHKRRLLWKTFAEILVAHKGEYIRRHELLVPVPLSRTRFSERGFNQCLLISSGIARRVGIPFHGEILRRKGDSMPQSSLRSREARLQNMKDRFVLRERWRYLLPGKNVLLFDDVMTTGATASSCAGALYGAGARHVDLLTLSRALVEAASVEFP